MEDEFGSTGPHIPGEMERREANGKKSGAQYIATMASELLTILDTGNMGAANAQMAQMIEALQRLRGR